MHNLVLPLYPVSKAEFAYDTPPMGHNSSISPEYDPLTQIYETLKRLNLRPGQVYSVPQELYRPFGPWILKSNKMHP